MSQDDCDEQLSSIEQDPHIIHHFRRSNAIRIKSENYAVLPASLRRSILAFNPCLDQKSKSTRLSRETNHETDESTLLDQIKRGVRLHPVGKIARRPLTRAKQNHINNVEQETLSEILARVLKKRNLVMQQTDDESDQSSIDSQPDHYEITNDLISEKLTFAKSSREKNSDFRLSSPDKSQTATGRIDIIVHL